MFLLRFRAGVHGLGKDRMVHTLRVGKAIKV